MKLVKIIQRKLNKDYYNSLIKHFFEEVADDIKIIEGEIYRNNPNQFINQLSKELRLDILSKKAVQTKYEEKYCPTCLFEYFNKSEKINYLIMRNKIDKILNIKEVVYQI